MCRQIERLVLEEEASGVKRSAGLIRSNSRLDLLDSDLERQKRALARLHPPFPAELQPRVLLMIRTGQLVQVSRLKSVEDVDWCYGIVITKPKDVDAGHQDQRHGKAGAGEHHGIEAINGCDLRNSSGWFPASYTTAPTDEQILLYQESLGGSSAATGALKVPEYWVQARAQTEEDTIGAVLYDVDPTSNEYERVAKDFDAGAGGMRDNNTPQMETLKVGRGKGQESGSGPGLRARVGVRVGVGARRWGRARGRRRRQV